MKKLMMAAAIVCAAVGAQAAVFDWSFQEKILSSKAGSVTDLAGMTMYVMTAADYTTFTAGDTTFENFNKYVLGDGVEVAKSGTALLTWTAANTDPVTATWTAGTTADLMFVVVDSGNANYAAIAGGTAAEAYEAGALTPGQTGKLEIGKDDSTHFKPANFTAFSVPEPTSGLLLLLGVAGLALRRRRA